MKGVKLFKEENVRVRFLTEDEEERLLKSASPHVKEFIVFAINTGMRRGEIFNLKWSAVDFDNGHIHVLKAKNKEKRVVSL